MREVDIKLHLMYNLLELSNSHTFRQFKNAKSNNLRNKPWPLKEPLDEKGNRVRHPRVRLAGKQDQLYKQLYRCFRGELPKERLIPLTTRFDYNPWNWGVSKLNVKKPKPKPPEIVIKPLNPDLEDLVNLIKTRTLHGQIDPWFEVDEIYSQEEIQEVKDYLDGGNEA